MLKIYNFYIFLSFIVYYYNTHYQLSADVIIMSFFSLPSAFLVKKKMPELSSGKFPQGKLVYTSGHVEVSPVVFLLVRNGFLLTTLIWIQKRAHRFSSSFFFPFLSIHWYLWKCNYSLIGLTCDYYECSGYVKCSFPIGINTFFLPSFPLCLIPVCGVTCLLVNIRTVSTYSAAMPHHLGNLPFLVHLLYDNLLLSRH